ncbi:MAG: type I glyceraldehyde-3-phosphate dehydrogenase [Candidatus Gracilibacteria bacterium]
MAIKVAINGFGRIGRNAAKIILDKYKDTLELVAINDLTDSATLAHLFKYDSLYGIYPQEVTSTDKTITIGTQIVHVSAEKDPAVLPWKTLGVDIVLECTGVFTDMKGCEAHIKAGAKKVVLSAPAKDSMPTFVLGVNEKEYKAEMNIISNASCTTNSLAPVAKVLHDAYGIEAGLLTTVHSFTQDQRLHDAPHKDLRRARAATESIIPTTTGAAKSVAAVIPDLEGKLDGISLRVPTPVVSLSDFTCTVKNPPKDVTEINTLLTKYANTTMSGIMAVSDLPLVSMDFRKNENSTIIDLPSTFFMPPNLIKVITWYDNEWGYSNRLVDLAYYISK